MLRTARDGKPLGILPREVDTKTDGGTPAGRDAVHRLPTSGIPTLTRETSTASDHRQGVGLLHLTPCTSLPT